MAEELDMPPVAAASDPDDVVIVLTDEDGNETEHHIIEMLKIGGKLYVILEPLTPDSNHTEQYAVLRVDTDPVTGEDHLVDIEDEEEFERVAIAANAAVDGLPYCRVCGCTDAYGCDEGCSWAEPNLCSSCVGKETTGEPGGAPRKGE